MHITLSSQRLQILAAAIVWLAGVSFLNLNLGSGVYLSQLVLLATVVWAVLACVMTRRGFLGFVGVLGALILLNGMSMLLSDVPTQRFAEEAMKTALTVVGAWALITLRGLTRHLLLLFPIVIVAVVAFTYLFVNWDIYDPTLSRFMVPQWGSPNSTAFVIGAALLVHTGTRWWGEAIPVWARPVTRVAWTLVIVVLVLSLLATYSRGGALATVAGLFGRYKRGFFASVGFWLLLGLGYYMLQGSGIERANLIAELTTSGGTGRLEMWASLVREWVETPLTILIGKGPGSVDLWRNGAAVNSAHSGVVTLVYFYGLAGVGLFAWLGGRVASRLRSIRSGHQAVATSAAWFLLGAAVVDYYFGVAQLLWVGALMAAAVWVAEQRGEEDEPEITGPPIDA